MASADKFSKLPELAKPSLYEIKLAPCLNTFEYKGSEKIHLDITKPTDYLKLHSSGIGVEKVSLKLADGSVLTDLRNEIDNKWELLTVHLPNKVEPQKTELDIEFNGKIRSDLEGFYRSPYKIGEETYHLASTQFESTSARRAFPCWDEPTYKAQFDIQLEVEKELTALSNMEVKSEEPVANGRKLVTYGRTPLMSTYLVAFAIGKFEYVEAKTKDGIVVRVYTLPGRKERGTYALEVAVKSFDYYTEWYGIKQPLPKCDLIAIPQFAMGAMENWGLITFREAALLFDPSLTSSATKQRITLTVSHEVGHFWFGNLVTMKWWSDLWLKEGFASFMEYVFTNANYPDFQIWLDFVNAEVTNAMRLDSLRSSHPIEVPIENPNELDEIYDSITYSKSNSCIRMLFNYLGEPTFQKGLRVYLDKHKFSNAVTEDLWQALSQASGQDIGALMSSWTKQMGFPLLSVEQKKLEGDKRELHIKQRRFLADGGDDESNPQWQIPIPVSTSADPTKPKQKFLMTKREEKFLLEGVKPNEWVKLNSDFTSLFRVQYSDEMFEQLLEGIKNRQMNTLDRFQIASDLYAVIHSGVMRLTRFLDFLKVCGKEDTLVVWDAICSTITEIDLVLGHYNDNGALKNRFNQFVCQIVEPVAARYGWEPKGDEDHQTKQLRATLLGLLSRCQHQPTIQIALQKFRDYVAQQSAAKEGAKASDMNPDLRGLIFATAARTNDKKFVADLLNILSTSSFNEIERACILALGQVSDPQLLDQIFKHGIEQENIKSQDAIYLFIASSMSAASTQKHSWEFLKKNLQKLIGMYGTASSSLFQHCLKSSVRRFCSSSYAEEFQNFCKANFDEHTLNTLDRPIRQSVESIKLNENLLKNTVPDLEEYLKAAGY